MRLRPISDYLTDFDDTLIDQAERALEPTPEPAPKEPEPADVIWDRRLTAAPVPPRIDETKAKIDEAYQRGREEVRQELTALFEADIAAERESAARELESARALWADEEARTLMLSLDAGLARIHESLADQLAAILQPVMDDAVTSRAVEALGQSLAPFFSGEDGPLIRIDGPADLVARLRNQIPTNRVVAFGETGGAEITVTAGDTIMQTRIQGWRKALAALDRPGVAA